MKITYKHDVPFGRKEHAIEHQEDMSQKIKEEIAVHITKFLPTPALKGGANEELFYEENFFLYTADKIIGVTQLLKRIQYSTQDQSIRQAIQLAINHLHSEEPL